MKDWKNMLDVIYGVASFVIAAAAFWLGAARLFARKKLFYMKLLVCAAGCFMLEQQLLLINLWCGVHEVFSIGMLGILGCNYFLLSANYGTIDKIVDDDAKENRTARLLAIIAPVVVALLCLNAFFSWKDKDIICAVLWMIMLLPAIPASYLNLKHILLPIDASGFLSVTKNCNISALILYVVMTFFVRCSATDNSRLVGILSLLMSLAVFGITVSAVRGAEKWRI